MPLIYLKQIKGLKLPQANTYIFQDVSLRVNFHSLHFNVFIFLFSSSDLNQHVMKILPVQESTDTHLHTSALSMCLSHKDLTGTYVG